MNKISDLLNLIFKILFTWIVICVLIVSLKLNVVIPIISCGVVFLILKKWEKISRFFDKLVINYGKISKFLLLLLIGIQLIFLSRIFSRPFDDVKIVFELAYNFAQTGDFTPLSSLNNEYLATFTNNIFIFFIESYICRLIYLITNWDNSILYYIILIIGNIFAIDLGIYFSIKIVRKLFDEKKALFYQVVSLGFIPVYTYITYVYTDTLSMPIITGIVLLYLKIDKNSLVKKNFTLCVAIGVLSLMGYKLKGSVAIVLIAIIIFNFIKFDFLKSIKYCGIILGAFLVAACTYNSFLNYSQLVTKEQRNRCEFPIVHWIMLGLNDEAYTTNPYSGYRPEDPQYTARSGEYSEKISANVKEIKNRIKSKGTNGMIYFISRKTGKYTWGDGTYGSVARVRYDDVIGERNIFHEIFMLEGKYNGIYKFYCQTYHLVVLMLILCSALIRDKKSVNENIRFFKLIVIGFILFFSLWESCSRFLLHFYLIFSILAIDGIIKLKTLLNDTNKIMIRIHRLIKNSDNLLDSIDENK